VRRSRAGWAQPSDGECGPVQSHSTGRGGGAAAGSPASAVRHDEGFERFERFFAIKRLHPHHLEDSQVRTMFLDEARIAGLVRHANVVSVIDVGSDAEGPFLVMDYVDGIALDRILRHHAEAPMPLQIALRIGSQICAGLHAAHELVGPDGTPLRLVHRDVSPSNILVGFDGIARVTDFGIAKALDQSSRTATGIIKGKISYASPEQLRYEPLDRRSDLFSFGIVLYELTGGSHPFGDDPTSRARAMLRGEVPDLGVVREDAPPPLVELVYELLAGDSHLRPPAARDVQHRLDAMVAELAVVEGPLDVADYMERVFGETREKNARARMDAVRAAKANEPAAEPELPPAAETPVARPKPRRPIAIGVAIVVLAALASIPAILFALESTRAERHDPPPALTRIPEAVAPDAGPTVVASVAVAPEEPLEPRPPRVRTKRTTERMSSGTGPPLWMWE
jgi:serine/threonine-protein kinase